MYFSVCRATSVWFPHVLFVKSGDIPLEKPGNYIKEWSRFSFSSNGAPALLLALQKYSLNISICTARTTASFFLNHIDAGFQTCSVGPRSCGFYVLLLVCGKWRIFILFIF